MPASHHEVKGPQSARDRRLIMQVVDYWESLRGSNPFPLMLDFDIMAIPGMADHSFLIDIDIRNLNGSHLRYVGNSLAVDCSRDLIGRPVTSVPRGSLVSRLTDHFLQILANRAPMSFEAEYGHGEGLITKYRGIMLPLSNDGDEIDFILGVINSRNDRVPISRAPNRPLLMSKDVRSPAPAKAEDPGATFLKLSTANLADDDQIDIPPVRPLAPAKPPAAPAVPETTSANPAAVPAGIDESEFADLLDQLRECRGAAYVVRDAQERATRTVYKALTAALELIVNLEDQPEALAALQADNGIAQPGDDLVMSVLRMMFGRDHNQESLAVYATALRRAQRDRQTPKSLMDFLEGAEDGLAGLMREEPIPLSFNGLLKAH